MLRNSNKEEEKIKNKRNLDQQKCREIMNMQVQAKEKEKLLRNTANDESKNIDEFIKTERQIKLQDLQDKIQTKKMIMEMTVFNREQAKVKGTIKTQRRQDEIQGKEYEAFLGSQSYQDVLDKYEIKRQNEFKLIKNRVNEITDLQQKASIDPLLSKQKQLNEDRKIEEYQDKLYIKEYTDRKVKQEQMRKQIQEIKSFSDIIIKQKEQQKLIEKEADKRIQEAMREEL